MIQYILLDLGEKHYSKDLFFLIFECKSTGEKWSQNTHKYFSINKF